MAMSYQEIFTRCAVHMLRQGKRSLVDGKCMYRGSNGTKCAVGVLIPDMFYSKELEGNSVGSPEVSQALIMSGVLEGEDTPERRSKLNLLRYLQNIHDTAPVIFWESELRISANSRFLQMPDMAAMDDLCAVSVTDPISTEVSSTAVTTEV